MVPSDVLTSFRAHQNYLITSHINPDGDSLGAQLAIGRLLHLLKKRFQIVNRDPVPVALRFLEGSSSIGDPRCLEGKEFDCCVVVDASSLSRTSLHFHAHTILNIDHHRDNAGFGTVNWVRPNASSSCELVYDIFEGLELPFDRIFGECVYVGLRTDTGDFRFSNTNERVFQICAALWKQGIHAPDLNRFLHRNDSLARVRLRARILSTADLFFSGKVSLMEYPTAWIQDCGALPEDTEGMADETLRLKGSEVGVLVRYDAEKCKINLRSGGKVDVGSVAKHFGGGGHADAAAFEVKDPYLTLKPVLLQKIGELFGPSETA